MVSPVFTTNKSLNEDSKVEVSLSDDITYHFFFRYFYVQDLNTCKLVCKTWKKFIVDKELIERVTLSFLGIYQLPQPMTSWKHCYDVVRNNFFNSQPTTLQTQKLSFTHAFCVNDNILIYEAVNKENVCESYKIDLVSGKEECIKPFFNEVQSNENYFIISGAEVLIINARTLEQYEIPSLFARETYWIEFFTYNDLIVFLIGYMGEQEIVVSNLKGNILQRAFADATTLTIGHLEYFFSFVGHPKKKKAVKFTLTDKESQKVIFSSVMDNDDRFPVMLQVNNGPLTENLTANPSLIDLWKLRLRAGIAGMKALTFSDAKYLYSWGTRFIVRCEKANNSKLELIDLFKTADTTRPIAEIPKTFSFKTKIASKLSKLLVLISWLFQTLWQQTKNYLQRFKIRVLSRQQ